MTSWLVRESCADARQYLQADPVMQRWGILPPGVCNLQRQDTSIPDKTGGPSSAGRHVFKHFKHPMAS